MDFARFQEDSPQIADALLREQHLVVGLNHGSSSSTIPRSSPEDVGFEEQFGPDGIENGLRRGGDAIDFKVFVHDEENVEIFGGWFRSDKAAPNEDPAQSSVCGGEFQERPKAA